MLNLFRGYSSGNLLKNGIEPSSKKERKRGVEIAMQEPEIELKDFLSEVRHGEVRILVVDGKLFCIPKQIIERPKKYGIRVDMLVDVSIRLKQS